MKRVGDKVSLYTWRSGRYKRATWFNMLKADLTTATVEGGRRGGGVSLRAGASAWSNRPYINDTMPTSWVALSVRTSCVGSSSFLSNRSPELQSANMQHRTNTNTVHYSLCSIHTGLSVCLSVNSTEFQNDSVRFHMRSVNTTVTIFAMHSRAAVSSFCMAVT